MPKRIDKKIVPKRYRLSKSQTEDWDAAMVFVKKSGDTPSAWVRKVIMNAVDKILEANQFQERRQTERANIHFH